MQKVQDEMRKLKVEDGADAEDHVIDLDRAINQIVPDLAKISRAQLVLLAGQEAQGRNRTTLLSKIDKMIRDSAGGRSPNTNSSGSKGSPGSPDLNMSIKVIEEDLPNLTKDQLRTLRVAEAAGKKRKTLLAKLDKLI